MRLPLKLGRAKQLPGTGAAAAVSLAGTALDACQKYVSRAHGDDWRDEAEVRQRPTNDDDLRRSDRSLLPGSWLANHVEAPTSKFLKSAGCGWRGGCREKTRPIAGAKRRTR